MSNNNTQKRTCAEPESHRDKRVRTSGSTTTTSNVAPPVEVAAFANDLAPQASQGEALASFHHDDIVRIYSAQNEVEGFLKHPLKPVTPDLRLLDIDEWSSMNIPSMIHLIQHASMEQLTNLFLVPSRLIFAFEGAFAEPLLKHLLDPFPYIVMRFWKHTRSFVALKGMFTQHALGEINDVIVESMRVLAPYQKLDRSAMANTDRIDRVRQFREGFREVIHFPSNEVLEALLPDHWIFTLCFSKTEMVKLFKLRRTIGTCAFDLLPDVQMDVFEKIMELFVFFKSESMESLFRTGSWEPTTEGRNNDGADAGVHVGLFYTFTLKNHNGESVAEPQFKTLTSFGKFWSKLALQDLFCFWYVRGMTPLQFMVSGACVDALGEQKYTDW